MKYELISLISMAAVFAVCCTKIPESTGIKDGQLSKCPDKPNCVSSTAKDKIHSIAPLKYSADYNKARNTLLDTIRSMKRVKIITDSDNYIHAEFRSLLFRFTDDVEFLIDDKNKVINLRSASRVGYSDMGVNRKRIESLRKIFGEKIK